MEITWHPALETGDRKRMKFLESDLQARSTPYLSTKIVKAALDVLKIEETPTHIQFS